MVQSSSFRKQAARRRRTVRPSSTLSTLGARLRGRLIWLPVALSLALSVLALGWLLTIPAAALSTHLPEGSERQDPQLAPASPAVSFLPSSHFTPQIIHWQSEIQRWSQEYQLDPLLIATVMQIESCGHPTVLSRSGAIGLFQVMPYHFGPGEDPFDPDTNAKRGLSYLKRGLEIAGGQIDLALAGYNGGHGVIDRHQDTWAEETRRYVRWGSGILHEIGSEAASSSTLQAWLDAGGLHLCQRSSQALALDG